MQDVRHALRQLLKSPGFTVVALLTLALGIGANTAIFSVINGVLLRPMPFAAPDELVRLYHRSPNFPKASFAAGAFFSVQKDQGTFDAVGAWQTANFSLVAEGTAPERVPGAVFTDQVFRALRVAPALGRTFKPEEFFPGADGVVLLSHTLWQQRFGGRADVLGRTLEVSGRPREIIGVMPPGFDFPSKCLLWTPFAPDDFNRNRRDLHNLQVFGRLKPGATLEQARADLAVLTQRYAREFATTDQDWACVAYAMLDDYVANVRPALVVLLAAVVALLLIACANVTNLLLARAAARTREISIRAALGASRVRLMRQLTVESLVLFLFGGAAGTLLGQWLLHALLALAPASIPRLDEVAIDGRVLACTAGATFLIGLVFGLIPAWHASRTDLTLALREGHGTTASRGWLRHSLVVVQVAAAVVLLVSSGLLIRSFHRLQQVDAGFDTARILTLRVDLPLARYGTLGTNDEKRIQFAREVVRRLQALPGVASAALTTSAPLQPGPNFIMRLESNPNVNVSTAPVTSYRTISPDYFRAIGMRLVRGRSFTERDAPGAPRVVIINEAFARKFFPGVADPLGRRVEVALADPPNWAEVVGVVADAKINGLDAETPVQAYEPYHVFPFNNLTFVIRAAGEPGALAAAMRREVQAVDPTLPVHTQKTMEQIYDESLGQRYFSLLLVAVFAAVALVLAGIGLYGVIAYGVAQRTREFGVRLALGASRADIVRLVMGQGGRLIGLGLLLGIGGSLLAAGLMQSLLFGIGARDPLTFAAIVGVLGVVAAAACLVPALRATKVDPLVALRTD